MIQYRTDKNFEAEQLKELFSSVNWLSANYSERLVKALYNSSTVISAWDGEKLIGLINALDDGELTAYVHYLLVNPEYQKDGIGTRLVEMIKQKYKDYLWKLGDTDSDNPEAVTDNFCNGYWLRSPMGNADANSGYAYIVDLVNGMIRPEAVKPDGGSTDEELRVTTSIGVRPAFAVPQG